MRKVLLASLLLPVLSLAHEPIFGLGPGTIFKGGVGIETEYERDGSEDGVATELLYGLTEDISVTFRAFNDFNKFQGYGSRVKFRLWKRYMPGTLDALSVIVGVIHSVERDVSYGLVGTAIGRESRRWYFFADVRKADKLYLDGAVGIRPWLTEYLKPDLVLLMELNYESKGGYRVYFLSPALFFTYRNLAIKGGIQIPVEKSERAKGVESRSALSVEVHF